MQDALKKAKGKKINLVFSLNCLRLAIFNIKLRAMDGKQDSVLVPFLHLYTYRSSYG